MLSSHLCPSLTSGFFPSVFPTKTLYTVLFSLMCVTYRTHLILLHFIALIISVEEHQSLRVSLCYFSQSPVTSSLLGPNVPLSTLFSNALNLYYSLIQQTKITGKKCSSAYSNPFGFRTADGSELTKRELFTVLE